MTVMVPCENAGKAGLRRVIDEETVKKVLAVLSDDVSEMPKNWNRRFKHNRDKIKTGDIYELAEVVRNLAIREQDKGLSTGEKQMFTRAKKILASELMYALEMGEEEAEEHLDDLLQRSGDEKLARRRASARGLELMAVALLVAAGSGERLGAERPKAFVVLAGPARCWSGASPRCGRRGGSSRSWSRLPPRRATAPAGPRRRRRRRRDPLGVRARRALAAAPARTREAVVVHDAARPLVTPELFRAALRGARRTPTRRSPPRR